ncbi:MAG TPA: ribulose-phosphate 3-epimerase [Armatimonadota bacterium]|nr:ribulose-phosphate 3-epimerase [Armatimonadota bacterium]
MVEIEPSLLSADWSRLGEATEEAIMAGARTLQVDVMDGCFVPNLAFGPQFVKSLCSRIQANIDVHLMVEDPERFIPAFVNAGADQIIIHQERNWHLYRSLQFIHEHGVKVGVALNPGTPIETLSEVIHLVNVVQLMTVNPGFGGQKFLHSQLPKIRRLKTWLDELELAIPIAVDGGITTETAPLAVKAGATILVSGSSVFNQQASVVENIARLHASIADVE